MSNKLIQVTGGYVGEYVSEGEYSLTKKEFENRTKEMAAVKFLDDDELTVYKIHFSKMIND